MSEVHSFVPLIDERSKILIVGSMPGIESLRRQEYYGYSYNAFWRLMFDLLNEKASELYAYKKAMLLEHGIALWDALKTCSREGSADQLIENAVPNDFNALLNHYQSVHHIFFNGRKAEAFFNKLIKPKLCVGRVLQFVLLPSTSPANARMNYLQKRERWKSILIPIQSGGIKY